jgi:hypothetical protein
MHTSDSQQMRPKKLKQLTTFTLVTLAMRGSVVTVVASGIRIQMIGALADHHVSRESGIFTVNEITTLEVQMSKNPIEDSFRSSF